MVKKNRKNPEEFLILREIFETIQEAQRLSAKNAGASSLADSILKDLESVEARCRGSTISQRELRRISKRILREILKSASDIF